MVSATPGLQVMLVGDGLENSGLIADTLRARGHAVTACPDAESGALALERGTYPLLVIDWNLPGMQGEQLCRRIRAHPVGADSVILVLSARPARCDLDAILAAGADDYLVKPVSIDEFAMRLTVAERKIARVLQRRQSELALRKSEVRLRRLTELSSDMYAEQDEHFRYTLRFPQSATATGGAYDEQDILGKTRWEIDITPEPGHDMAAHRRTLAAHLPFRDFEYSVLTKGSRKYYSVNGIPLFDERGKFTGYASIGRNITDRKQAVEALRQSEQRFRDLVELSADWYWEQDDQFRFTYWSQDLRDAPFSPAEVLGKRRWEIDGAQADSASWAQHKALVQAHQSFREFEYSRRMPDGNLMHISVSGRPQFSAQGAFLGYLGVANNISKRISAEQVLRERENQLRNANEKLNTLIESSPLSIYTRDRNGLLLSWNAAAEKTYGWTAAEVIGKPLPTVPDEMREESDQLRERLLNGEQFIGLETHRCRRDGSKVYVNGYLSPLRDAAGNINGIITIIADITERKRAQQMLLQREQQFRDLVELSSDWYWEQDAELRYTFISPGWQEKSALGTNALLGKTRWELPITGVSGEQWRAHRAQLARREPFRDFTYESVDKNGYPRWTSVSGKPIFDKSGRLLGYRGTGRDISDAVRAERLLRESESRLREAQRMARLGGWERDLANDALIWSDEMFRIFEIDPARFSGSYHTQIAAVHPDDRANVAKVYARSMRERVPYEIKLRLLMADGRIKHVYEHGRTIYDRHGQAVRSRGIMQDISKQQQVETELRTYAGRLQNMARRLGEAQEVERRRLAAELHDGVSSSLAAIGLNLALLQRQLPGGDPASIQQRLSALIELIDEAKGKAKDISIDLRPLLLEERGLISALEDYARKFQANTGIAVKLKNAVSGQRLPAEKKIALFRIAQEALTNCAKHAQASAVAIELNTSADHLLLSIADDGIGINLTDPNLAKPGLGLLSMQERAEAIGGKWQIESTPGNGTRVIVSVGSVPAREAIAK